jgi:hypothetical protein
LIASDCLHANHGTEVIAVLFGGSFNMRAAVRRGGDGDEMP